TGAFVGAMALWAASRPLNRLLGWFFTMFNRGFQATAWGYANLVGVLLRRFIRVLLGYGGMLGLTYYAYAGFPKEMVDYAHKHSWLRPVTQYVYTHEWAKPVVQFPGLPRGFIPSQDMGYLLCNVQLPDSASLERTQAVIDTINQIGHETPGVAATVGIAGQSLLLNAYGSNFGTMFITLAEFSKRPTPDLYYEAIANKLRQVIPTRIHDATITIFGPPPVRGVGRAGGYMIMLEDRGDLGPRALQEQTDNIVELSNQQPQLMGNTAVFRANVPQIYLDVDRTACMLKGVQLQDVFDTLQVYLGSLYI